jgi:4-alpha-glucanotransferase
MRVLQFGFGGGSYDRPHNHPRHCLAYTGTHDNPTTVGWWRTLGAPDRARLRDYLGLASPRPTARAAAAALLAALWSSPAGTAVAPLQDLLGLDDRARTNVPGTARGNWSWRLADGALTAPLAATLRAHLELTDRVPRG